MDALIYTRDDREYEMLSGIFADESPGTAATRGLLDGHSHLEKKYDVVVVDMDGALGMEIVCKYREVYGNTLVIWITDDCYFGGRYGCMFSTLSCGRPRKRGSGSLHRRLCRQQQGECSETEDNSSQNMEGKDKGLFLFRKRFVENRFDGKSSGYYWE